MSNLNNLTTAFARWRFAPRTAETPSQLANPFDLEQHDDPHRDSHPTLWFLLGLGAGIAGGYLLAAARGAFL